MNTEKNRRQRKARWIRVKNSFRDAECSDGVIHTNHVYDPKYPWTWVDFRFLSQRHSRRYFAVAAQTLESALLSDIEDEVYDIIEANAPLAYFDKRILTMEEVDAAWEEDRTRFAEEQEKIIALGPRVMYPKIEVRRDYGEVCIGLWVTLNTQHIDHQVLHQFVDHFRALGEPIQHGIVWQGQGVEIDPREVTERYERVYSAKSREDS